MQAVFNNELNYTILVGTEGESNFLLNTCSFPVQVTTQNSSLTVCTTEIKEDMCRFEALMEHIRI